MSTLATSTDFRSILTNHAASQGIYSDLCECLDDVLLVAILMDSRNGVIPGLLIDDKEIALLVHESGKYIDKSSNTDDGFREARTHKYYLNIVLRSLENGFGLMKHDPVLEMYIKTIIREDGFGAEYKVFGKIESAKEFNLDDFELLQRQDIMHVIKTACIGQVMRNVRRHVAEAATRD